MVYSWLMFLICKIFILLLAGCIASIPLLNQASGSVQTQPPSSLLSGAVENIELTRLEEAERKAHEHFAATLSSAPSLYDARAKGYRALHAADITYDHESEKFFTIAIAWFRYAAFNGDEMAAGELARRYRELSRHYLRGGVVWWSHLKRDKKLGHAYSALSCKWYQWAAKSGNQAALGYANWGPCRELGEKKQLQ